VLAAPMARRDQQSSDCHNLALFPENHGAERAGLDAPRVTSCGGSRESLPGGNGRWRVSQGRT